MKKNKRVLTFILTMCLILTNSMGLVVSAADSKAVDLTICPDGEDEKERDCSIPVASNGWKNWPEGPQTNGGAGIVMDAETGTILYAKNIDGKAYPASITKVLTLLLALENGKPDDIITVSEDAVYSVEYGYAHVGLEPGEEVRLEDMLYAVMLASANEAAYAVGENIGDGYESFLDQMNNRCKELGGKNSHFNNTNGMEDPQHYTTARDMALITRELLMNHPEFEEICQTLQYTIPGTNITDETRTFQQNHKMFYEWNPHYNEDVIAGKTGYTDVAKNTLITCAEKDGTKLVCVVLKTHGTNVYQDTQALLDYGFDNFSKVKLNLKDVKGSIKELPVTDTVMLPNGVDADKVDVKIVQNKDDKSKGRLIYQYAGRQIGNADVELSEKYIEEHETKDKKPLSPEKKKESKGMPFWAKCVLGILGVLIIVLVVWILLAFKVRKKQLDRKRKQKEKRKRM